MPGAASSAPQPGGQTSSNADPFTGAGGYVPGTPMDIDTGMHCVLKQRTTYTKLVAAWPGSCSPFGHSPCDRSKSPLWCLNSATIRLGLSPQYHITLKVTTVGCLSFLMCTCSTAWHYQLLCFLSCLVFSLKLKQQLSACHYLHGMLSDVCSTSVPWCVIQIVDKKHPAVVIAKYPRQGICSLTMRPAPKQF